MGPGFRALSGTLPLAVLACTGMIEDPFPPPADGPQASSSGAPTSTPSDPPVSCAPTPRRVRRLTLEQYETVVTDLIGTPPPVLGWSAPDTLVHGFDGFADALTVSSGNFEDFALAAEMIADAVDVTALAPCAPDELAASCAEAFLTSFAARAFGRSITPTERARLGGLYHAGAGVGGYERGVRLVVEGVLMSPHFLYRTELGPEPPAGAASVADANVQLGATEVANALSFALTGARPDDALRIRAESDPSFLEREALREEAARLGATPRAKQHLGRFLRSWLGIRDLKAVNKIPLLFPVFTPTLKAELDAELGAFLSYVLRDGGTLEALLGETVSFPSAQVFSTIYAADYVAPEAPPALPAPGNPVALNPAFRRGVLSLGGWLAAHAPVHRSSPVDRGLAIRNRLFCQNLPPPPPDVLSSAPSASAMETTRQRFEQHSADARCRSCHSLIDPIGFGFEMMDGIGRRRDVENGFPVDSSGELSGTDVDGPFTGPAELAEKLLGSRQVRDCFVVQMFRYLEGRDETASDACRLEPLRTAFAPSGGKIADLALEMVLAEAFSVRSVEP